MNAIILAAGEGTRLKRYTSDLPKGMLPFQGTPLIGHQLTCLRQAGIDRIAVVRGYRAMSIAFPEVHYFDNAQWACTNMVHSLLCAREWFDEAAVVKRAREFKL